jgi:antitoxin (DNA-binding transcriptional repressor) of toxin-antitoxin stability system
MDATSISVTEASRNFADCVNRARYQGTTFLLLRGGTPVARIEPAAREPKKGTELADALEKAVEGLHLGEEEATSWLHDLEQARGSLQTQVRPWRF